MQAAGRWLTLAVLASGLLAWQAASAPAAFILSAEFNDLPWLPGSIFTDTPPASEFGQEFGSAERPLWWPEGEEDNLPRLILGRVPLLPFGLCGSPRQPSGTQSGGWLAPVPAVIWEVDPVLISRLAVAEGKLSRLPPVPLDLLRPA